MHEASYVDLTACQEVDLPGCLADLPPRAYVLLPRSRYTLEVDHGQAGRSVALVGNGDVRNHGREIDAHDIVVRVNAAYNWRRDEREDGLRFDWWIGRGGMDMLDPERFLDPSQSAPAVPITADLSGCKKIIALGHAQLEAGFVDFVHRQDLRHAFVTILSAPYIFDRLDRERELIMDQEFAHLVYRKRYHHETRWWGGLWAWELLFTGVRACVLIALGRPSRLSLYGFDFYEQSNYVPWDMHNIQEAKAVIDRCAAYCREVGVEFRSVPSFSSRSNCDGAHRA